jgi:hypothetical protein
LRIYPVKISSFSIREAHDWFEDEREDVEISYALHQKMSSCNVETLTMERFLKVKVSLNVFKDLRDITVINLMSLGFSPAKYYSFCPSQPREHSSSTVE